MTDPLFWVAAALLSGIVALVLARPLLRARRAEDVSPAQDRAASDIAVYKAQLAEVERDLARGVLAAGQADAARIEIQRRLIRAGERAEAAPGGAGRRMPKPAAWAIALAVPLAGVAVYMAIGTPGAPDMPLNERIAAAQSRDADERARFETLTADLRNRLRDRPDDVTGWIMLGRSERLLGRYAPSLAAFETALKAAGGPAAAPADLLADIGESHVYTADGRVDAAARGWFERALARDPSHLKARHYLAVARSQAGDDRGALALMRGIEVEAPENAPWLPALRQRIAQLETRIGPGAETVQPERPAAPAAQQGGPFAGAVADRGPDRETMAAAAQMSPEEREAFIRGMVQRLADRLAATPDDPDGWVRLGRARTVLGEREEAKTAYERAAAIWRERLEKTAADAPERAEIEGRLRQVEQLAQ